jgi:hypothetical protein
MFGERGGTSQIIFISYIKKGRPMEYHIKWLGYEDPADDSREPEGGLTRGGTVENTHLNQYKQENNLQ